MKPVISVIMSVYNQEQFVKQSILSILRQSYGNFELIIIDDGSKDSSFKVISSFKDSRIRLIKNRYNMGLTKSINIGLKKARGEFIARMDGDDISYSNRFKLELDAFDKNKNLYLVGGQADLIRSNGKKIKTTSMPTDYKSLKRVAIRFNPFVHPTIMFQKRLLTKIGYYNERFRYSQDYDFILRALSCCQCQNLPKAILGLRLTGKSISAAKHRRQQLTAVSIRLNAIFNYGYAKYNLIFLIKPFISSLVPFSWKKIFYPT